MTIAKRFENWVDAMPASTRQKLPELFVDSTLPFKAVDIPIEQIISRETHELEKERIWSKVWQFACREEHIPSVGDQYVYNIAGKSYLIVRSAPDKIQAFVNSCLHRGRLLREYDGHAKDIRCPFHSFTWNLDGSIRMIPCVNEFAGRSKADWSLPQVRVDTWEGFVFINPDPDAESLLDYLGDLPAHFARWRLGERYVSAHVSKVVPCNWKIAQEAFMESFHVSSTHPQSMASLNDARGKVDHFGNFSRAMNLKGTPSPNLRWEATNQDVLDATLQRALDEPPIVTVPDGQGAREFMAAAQRERLRARIGDRVDDYEITELVDIFYYTLFPNFHPWGAFNEVVYRFRPNGDDHKTAIMEGIFLSPFAGERPPPAAPIHLTIDQWFSDVEDLGTLARIFDQDVYNMPKMQAGLETSAKGSVTLSAYQEAKISYFYHLHSRWLGRN